MISFPAGARIWLVAGVTDMRCSFNGLAAKVQNTLRADPFGGHLFIFRGRRGRVHLTQAQLAMLLEGINWKHPQRINPPGLRI